MSKIEGAAVVRTNLTDGGEKQTNQLMNLLLRGYIIVSSNSVVGDYVEYVLVKSFEE